MRRVRANIAAGGYAHDVYLRLYGPDDAGVIDTSAPTAMGRAPAHWHAGPAEYQEAAFQEGAFQGDASPAAGFQETAYQAQALQSEAPRTELLGHEHHFVVGEYGARAFNAAGYSSSATPTAAKVLVVSQPPPVIQASVAVVGGRIRMTVRQTEDAG